MSRKRTRPFDLPTMMLAVGPLLILTVLTAGWMRNSSARKTLMDAARNGDVKTLQRLLDHGVDINDQDGMGGTPLGYAANGRHYEAVKMLLDRGAKVNVVGRGYLRTPLSMACTSPDNMPYYTPNSTQSSTQNSTANTRIIRLLLDHGADPRLDDHDWNPPLLAVTQDGDAESARLLIEHGADVNAKLNGTTALYFAVQNAKLPLMKLLLAKGAAPNVQQDTNGETPLINAAENGNLAAVKLLLEHGARTDKKDSLGKTALQYATAGNRSQIAALLRRAGAKP